MDLAYLVGAVLVVVPLVLLSVLWASRAVLWAIYTAMRGRVACVVEKSYSSIDQLYEWLKERGDAIHIAYGAFVGNIVNKAVDQQSALLMTLAVLLSSLYVVYQYFDIGANRPKDVAVFAGSLSVVVGTHLGIPLTL